MSRETMQHLNTHTLIGNTAQRGTAWHYRAEEQGEESNHYPGPIPVEDVERRLFRWEAVSRRIAVEIPADVDDDDPPRPARLPGPLGPGRRPAGHLPLRHRRRDGDLRPGYEMHQYREWLLSTVANILDDDLVDLLRRTAPRRGDRLGGGLGARVDHHPGRVRVPAQPAGHHQLRRVHRHHLQADRHRRRSATTPATWPLSRGGADLQGQALPVLPREDHRRPGGAGHGPHPRRRLRQGARGPRQHPRRRTPVAGLPRRPRPPRRRQGPRPRGPLSDAGDAGSGESWRTCTATTTGPRRGPAPPSACSRRPTPGRTTTPPSDEPRGASGTSSTPSTAPRPPRTDRPSHSS